MANFSQEVLKELADIRKRLELLMDQHAEGSEEENDLLLAWGEVDSLIPAFFDTED